MIAHEPTELTIAIIAGSRFDYRYTASYRHSIIMLHGYFRPLQYYFMLFIGDRITVTLQKKYVVVLTT